LRFTLWSRAAPAEHAVEFVDQERDGLVTFVGLHRGVDVGSMNHHMAFGLEPGGDSFLGIAFEVKADAHDLLLVAEQTLGFFLDEGFERRSQLEVNPGNDEFMLVCFVCS